MADQEIDLQEKFPSLQPIRSAPSLFTINGCGLMLYGSRDYDRDTETYVKTQCLTFLFVPLLAVKALRVANAEQGWYFIGREPLSAFARIWNAFLAIGVLAAIGIGSWTAYTSSPEYVARKDLEQANELADAGKWREAASQYVKVIQSNTSSSAAARTRIDKLFSDTAEKADADEGLALIALGEQLRQQAIDIAGLEDVALELAIRHAVKNPRKSLEILHIVDRFPIVPEEKTPEVTKRRMGIRETVLVALVAAEKHAVDAASELAVIRESQGKLDECKTLLEPHLARLADTEGARILGQMYARGGDVEQAHRLLVPYCKRRLIALHEAESTFDRAQQNVIQRLQHEKPPPELERQLKAAGKDRQQVLIQEYFARHLRADVSVADARRDLQRAARVVPVALDLGIVLLQRSRTLRDAAARQRELKQAEETFLAIRGVAGETDEYRIFLGQVYYWMGKQQQGRALFDEFLTKRKRDYAGLIMLASTLRSLGATTEARKLAEEAHKTAAKDDDRHSAASLRALLADDIDDKVVWLRRAGSKSLTVQADLNAALGHQAARNGHNSGAAGYYRIAIGIYDKMPADSTTLNNGGLAWLSLYRVTGDRNDFHQGMQRIEKAIALEPSESILIYNSAYLLHEAAAGEIVGKSLDLAALQIAPELEHLRYLYRNEQERSAWIQRVRNHPVMKRSGEYFEKAMLLAPQRTGSYQQVAATRNFTQDLAGLKALVEKLRTANVDAASNEKQVLDFIHGRDLEKTRRQHRVDISRLRKAIAALKDRKDATFALACSRLSGDLIELGMIGEKVDVDEIVRLAEDAHKAAASSGTQHGLVAALAFRALNSPADRDPAVRAKTAKYQRTLGSLYLLAALVRHDDAARARLQKNPDVVRVVALEKEIGTAFPNDRSAVEWALLSRLDPAAAGQVARAVLKDGVTEAYGQVLDYIAPVNPSRVMDSYWKMEMAGKNPHIAKVVERYRKLGIELPLPKQ